MIGLGCPSGLSVPFTAVAAAEITYCTFASDSTFDITNETSPPIDREQILGAHVI